MRTVTVKIKELAEIKSGGTPNTSKNELWNGEIPWITPADLSGYDKVYIAKGERNITDIGLKKSSAVLLPKGTILLSSRAPIGYLAIAQNSLCTNQGFKNLLCNKRPVNNIFLYYYLKQNIAYIKNFASGTTFSELSKTRLKNIKISICSDIDVQNKIVDILSKYDDLIENNNKRINTLEQMSDNLYKEWFVRFRFPGHETIEFENGIPKGWEVRRVRDCVKRLPFGKLYKPEDTLTSGKVIVIDQSRNAFVGYHNDIPSHVASIDSPIALFGDHSCKMEIMICPFSLSENVVPYVAKQGLLTVFLFYALHGIIETTEYKRHWSELTSKKILVPNISIQKLFAKKVVDNLKMALMMFEQNQNLIKQRDLLLPRLMSGKLEVTNENN